VLAALKAAEKVGGPVSPGIVPAKTAALG